MRLIFTSFLALLIITSCGRLPVTDVSPPSGHVLYAVDYDNSDYNTMVVSVSVPALGASNNIYQFASTAPGTYQIMDIGRFVSDFKAFDAKGKELPTTKISTNQYKLHDPASVRSLQYKVDETWDTPVDEYKVYRMCGTSIEADHFLFNAHCALGYFKGLQAMPIKLRILPMEGWQVGTALEKDITGHYIADDYDHLVDSPILMGELSLATTDVSGSKVEIYTYSMTGMIHSDQILASMEEMLRAAASFLEGLPIDRYTFLFHFENSSHGAWEHSYSSEYIYKEEEWHLIEERVMATASHEFFHIVTPLNIHSEIIEQFNFVEPTPSQHLWLYEGVTEWASDMILLHGGQIDMSEYLKRHQEKLIVDELMYSQEYSLVDLAKTSYTKEGQSQYGNIYNVGAVIASLLDLRIIELSKGEQTLRELIVDLSGAYGPDLPFSEQAFFDEIVMRTHPMIETFIDDYIKGTEPLPVGEYYSTIGIDYAEEFVDSNSSGLGFLYYPIASGLYIVTAPSLEENSALKRRDMITSINGVPINIANEEEFMAEFSHLPVGTSYEIGVYRNGQAKTLECTTVMKREYHLLRPKDNASPEQIALRQVWLGK